MIKFFKRVRLNQVEKNKTGNYFKYAIGEIILVVIGILIALQINNWNTQRLNKKEEKVILENILKDLTLELENFKVHQNSQLVYKHSCEKIIELFNENGKFYVTDRLLANINDLFIRNSYVPNQTTFTTLENTGKLDLISNKELREWIITHAHNMTIFSENTKNNNTTLVDQLVNQSLLDLSFFQANSFSEAMQANWNVTSWEVPKVIDRSFFKEELQRKLKIKSNALKLMNLVNFRLLLVNVQLDYTVKREEETKRILETIREEIGVL